MNIISGVKSPSYGEFVFPLEIKFTNDKNEEQPNYTNRINVNEVSLFPDSIVNKKSKKLGIFNEETVNTYLKFMNKNMKSSMFHGAYNNYYSRTIYLPENPQILKDFIETAENNKTGIRDAVVLLARGLPAFGVNGKDAYYRFTRYSNAFVSHHGVNHGLHVSSPLHSDYDGRLLTLEAIGGMYHEPAKTVFAESLLILPMFLAFNDFLEYGDNEQTLREFLSNKTNWERINDYFKESKLPRYKGTKSLSLAFFNTVFYRRSFLYPSRSNSVINNKIANLPKHDIEFWVENYDKEVLHSPDDKLKKFKFDLWLEFVKNKGHIGASKTSLSKETYTKIINKAESRFTTEILPIVKRDYDEETVNKMNELLTIIFKTLRHNNLNKSFYDTISLFAYSTIVNNDKKNVDNVSVLTLALLLLALKHPGIFLKGAGKANLEAVIMETLDVFDYDDAKVTDLILFLANDQTIPQFNKTQWKNFVEMVKEQDLTDINNLTMYALIVIPNTRGVNDSADTIDIKTLKVLRTVERELEQNK